jgi:hypothetical protein
METEYLAWMYQDPLKDERMMRSALPLRDWHPGCLLKVNFVDDATESGSGMRA